jgi:hypothetical protein
MERWAVRSIAVAVVTLCLMVQFQASGGWYTIFGIFLWPAVGAMHLVAHSIRLKPDSKVSRPRMTLITVSHLLLISAFLLQYDQGDGPNWLTITALFGGGAAPTWWPNPGIMNLAVFLPVLVTWILLICRLPEATPTRQKDET